MLSPDYIAFHHARVLTRGGDEQTLRSDLVPQATPTMGLASEFPWYHTTIPATQTATGGSRHIFLSAATQEFRHLAFVFSFESTATRVGSFSIADRTCLYETLFKPEQSQLRDNSLLWATGVRRASTAQEWVVNLTKPSPALKSRVVERFNRLTAEWHETRNPASSVLDICGANFAYQQIIGLGKDAVPLILRELDRSLDHWFWALGAITGENPVAEAHRGRLALMAQDWFTWAKRVGHQW